MKLYHYTTFATFIDYILPTKKLKFGMLKNANDPKEFCQSFTWKPGFASNLSKEKREHSDELFFKEWEKFEYISFCLSSNTNQGYCVPSMWTHYGEKHNGVCIEIDTEKLNEKEYMFSNPVEYVGEISKVVYSDTPMDDELINSYKKHFIENKMPFFFQKHKCWEYEQEYRIINYNNTSNDCFLDISDAMTAVYCGTLMKQIRYDIIYLLTSQSFKLHTSRGILNYHEHIYNLVHQDKYEQNERLEKELAEKGIICLNNTSSKKTYFKKLIPRFNEIFGIEEE